MADNISEKTSRNLAKRTHEMMEMRAIRDSLTGLYNKSYFNAQMEGIDTNQPGTLAMVDVDNFKGVNDTHGHFVGDMILRSVSRILQDNVQTVGNGDGPDLVARWGGEEFAIYFKNLDDPLVVRQRLESIRTKVQESFVEKDKDKDKVKVTISAGVAFRRPQETYTDLFKRTDKAMYDAKVGGRNRIEFSKE